MDTQIGQVFIKEIGKDFDNHLFTWRVIMPVTGGLMARFDVVFDELDKRMTMENSMIYMKGDKYAEARALDG